MPPTPTLAALEAALAGREGVLPSQYLAQLIATGAIAAPVESPIPLANIQPASLDLRLGPVAYPLRCSFLPGRDSVASRLKTLRMFDEVDLSGDGGALEIGRPYLIPLQEGLRLPGSMRAKANPKSSTGDRKSVV